MGALDFVVDLPHPSLFRTGRPPTSGTMADLNPEVFEDLQVAERSRPLFEAAGLPLRTWEAYALAFNERNLLRREIQRIRERRGAADIHPEVLERLQALRTELDPMVGELRKFLPSEPAGPEAI